MAPIHRKNRSERSARIKTQPCSPHAAKIFNRAADWLLKYRYPLLCLTVFTLMSLHTRNQQWLGDFWEHSAVVRELITHPLHPEHPQLLLTAPHAFYSPYSLIVALIARAFSLDAISALSVMGMINLVLLLLGLRMFVLTLSPRHPEAAAFYTLLLTLFLWGADAWLFSGFFHIANLGFVLPYPSTFAIALALVALGLHRLQIKSKRKIDLLPVFLIAVVILISHPISCVFLAAGLVSQSILLRDFARSQTLWIGALLAAATLVAVCWPYYPVPAFFIREADVYHSSNHPMYQNVFGRIWPSLAAIPLLFLDIKSNKIRPLYLMLAILSGIYLFGALTQRYSYGRMISFIVLLLHILIAEHLASLEAWARDKHRSKGFIRLAVPVVVTSLALLLSFSPLKSTLERVFFPPPSTIQAYRFLSQYTGQYDVVLSDLQSSWIIPTFGGKVIAADHPLAFVPDHQDRQADLEHFFKPETTHPKRLQIARKYSADYLLLNKVNQPDWRNLLQSFSAEGVVVYDDDNFALISLGELHTSNGMRGHTGDRT